MDLLTAPIRGLLRFLIDTPRDSSTSILPTKDFELCIHLDGSRRIDNGNIGYCRLGEKFKDRKDICKFYRGSVSTETGIKHLCEYRPVSGYRRHDDAA